MTSEQPIPILDDITRVQLVDKRNMLRLINELPEQCETALGIGRSYVVEPLETMPNVVFITGIGDSGIAGDMAVATVSDETEVPVVSDHGGRLPKYVGEESLVLVVDYSGKSETTLRNYKEAKQRGAKVICITSGSKLLEAASKDGTKIIKMLPGQPKRTAIGYVYVPLITVLEQCGIVSGLADKLSYAIKLLKNSREALRFENRTERNVAKQAALELKGKPVVVFGAPGYRSVVANRFKIQLSGNSKTPTAASTFPNIVEGEIAGWEQANARNEDFGFVFLRDKDDKTEINDQMNACAEYFNNFSIVDLNIKGSTAIEKMLYGIYLGDYISLYLSLLNEVDPTTTESIKSIEAKLEETSEAE